MKEKPNLSLSLSTQGLPVVTSTQEPPLSVVNLSNTLLQCPQLPFCSASAPLLQGSHSPSAVLLAPRLQCSWLLVCSAPGSPSAVLPVPFCSAPSSPTTMPPAPLLPCSQIHTVDISGTASYSHILEMSLSLTVSSARVRVGGLGVTVLSPGLKLSPKPSVRDVARAH